MTLRAIFLLLGVVVPAQSDQSCPDSSIPNSNFKGANSLTGDFEHTKTVICDDSYFLTWPNGVVPGEIGGNSDVAYCNSQYLWIKPTCELVSCDALVVPNSDAEAVTGNLGDEKGFSCNKGFSTGNTNNLATCQTTLTPGQAEWVFDACIELTACNPSRILNSDYEAEDSLTGAIGDNTWSPVNPASTLTTRSATTTVLTPKMASEQTRALLTPACTRTLIGHP
jgi:hypothetical protein